MDKDTDHHHPIHNSSTHRDTTPTLPPLQVHRAIPTHPQHTQLCRLVVQVLQVTIRLLLRNLVRCHKVIHQCHFQCNHPRKLLMLIHTCCSISKLVRVPFKWPHSTTHQYLPRCYPMVQCHPLAHWFLGNVSQVSNILVWRVVHPTFRQTFIHRHNIHLSYRLQLFTKVITLHPNNPIQ